jgi:hypothetical protein
MYVTRISRYIQRSVLSADSRNGGRSWNVLPVDTGALLYIQNIIINERFHFTLQLISRQARASFDAVYATDSSVFSAFVINEFLRK